MANVGGPYCAKRAFPREKKQVDRLASGADITACLPLGRGALRIDKRFTQNQTGHASVDRLKVVRLQKGSGRHSTIRGQERSVFNQTDQFQELPWDILERCCRVHGSLGTHKKIHLYMNVDTHNHLTMTTINYTNSKTEITLWVARAM